MLEGKTVELEVGKTIELEVEVVDVNIINFFLDKVGLTLCFMWFLLCFACSIFLMKGE